MKHLKSTLITITLLISFQSNAQQIFTEIGRVTTQYKYTNSNGESDLDLFPTNDFSYAAGYRMTLSERFYLNGAAVFNRYGATASDEVYKNNFSWQTSYVGIAASLDGEFFKRRGYSGFARLSVEPQFMMSGTQTINGEIFSLKGVEQFDTPFTFLRGGFGFNWCSNSKIALSVKYMYGLGYPLSRGEDGEKLNLATNNISIGVMWSIKNCKYCYGKR